MYNRHGKSTPLVLGAKDFAKAVTGVSESTIVQLHVGADSFECLIKERQLDWLRGNIDHVDFFEVEKDVVIRAKVPVHLIGNSIGVREGGILENPVHEIEVECLPKDMPEKFEIDISDLHANHSIHVRDISHASAVKIHSSMDQVVVLVKYAKGEARCGSSTRRRACRRRPRARQISLYDRLRRFMQPSGWTPANYGRPLGRP
jgi:large subunit ribosomal protein L25